MSITPSTKISLAVILSLAAGTATIVGTGWRLLSAITAEIATTRQEVAELNHKVSAIQTDVYTQTRAAEVALRNAILNPGLRFSDPRAPDKYIWVKPGSVAPADAAVDGLN